MKAHLMSVRFRDCLMAGFVAVAVLLGGAVASDAKEPLKVFILTGQSNMQGHAHVRTMDVMALDPVTAPLLKDLRQEDGTPKVSERVWISSLGSSQEEKVGRLTEGYGAEPGGPKIGPELTFGIYLEKLLDEPVLIIKTAWGGKSINTDFRSPSAGDYPFNEQQLENFKKQGKDLDEITASKKAATGHYYRLMLQHVKQVLSDIQRVYPDYDAEAGYELAGLVWFQGWNDMVDRGTYPTREQPGGYDAYSEVLAHFVRDVRKDLGVPKLPFVIGVMGAGGPIKLYTKEKMRYAGVHQNFRDAMAAPAKLPEFKGTVTAVLTENYWDNELGTLREREKELKMAVESLRDQAKEGKLSRAEADVEIEALYADEFSEDELKLLRNGASNAEYHYWGSAKVMTQIGKAFAEAMHEMIK